MEKNEIDLLRSPNLIVLSTQNYTAAQKDIFTLAISQLEVGVNVNSSLFADKTVTVSVKMLSSMSGVNYHRLKAECVKMADKKIIIADDVKQEFKIITVFPIIEYKKNVIELTMLSKVAQAFLELKKGYAEYYIKESLSLDTFNKKRMYEMLSIFKNREYPEWYVLDSELKKLLGMLKDGEKDRFKGRHKEFQERVIELCVNAINDQTSLFVSYNREPKNGELGTRFFIKDKNKIGSGAPKKKQSLDEYIATLDEKAKLLYERLLKLTVRTDMIKTIIADAELTKQANKWLYDNADNIKNNKYKNAAAILLVTLGLVEVKIKTTKNTVGKEIN